jgi:hypothetical protein
MIALDTTDIDAALALVGDGLRQYEWLQARVNGPIGFERDPDFRRRFNGFYRVRRNQAWQDAFYGLMGRAKQDGLEFPQALQALHAATGRYEASFASKLVATFDTSKPVIDAFVLRNVGLRLPRPTVADRSARIYDVYCDLISAFSAFLDTEQGRYLVSAFKRLYPRADIATVKMLDLVLWKTRRAQPRSTRVRTARRGRLLPTSCPSCGAPTVARI